MGARGRTQAWAWEQDLKASQASPKEPLLGPWPTAPGGALLPSPRVARPTSWLLNEPLSVWSLLVLAPSSLWNRAQIPGKANRNRSFEEKASGPWKRDQPERYSSTHSSETPLNGNYPHPWVWCTD